ncbi:hemerythrin domain-containing protein [Aureivirga sp. CE67]|uniref:hemerythrin domain-containing protein n=1 Tax=Aureivirga sp. CE67 TaxID=1788983 RepID=UPI0018CB9758|nr:hemerythrin domain-containing protein [Aureivirga sp. CE67]
MNEKTLAEIVNDNFNAAWILKKHNIDFFQKSKCTIEETCLEKKIDFNSLQKELSNLKFDYEKEEIDLEFLVNYTEKLRNKYLNSQMSDILYLFSSYMANDANFYNENVELFELLKSLEVNLKLHLQKEEYFLFPKVRKEQFFGDKEVEMHKVFVLLKAEQKLISSLLERITTLLENKAQNEKYEQVYLKLTYFVNNFKEYLEVEKRLLFPKMEMI